jgi:hypothetical protein
MKHGSRVVPGADVVLLHVFGSEQSVGIALERNPKMALLVDYIVTTVQATDNHSYRLVLELV